MPTNKSLYRSYQDGDISSTERNKILEIGYIDDLPQLYLSSWKKLYYYQLIIDRLRSRINISNKIQTLILFSAHWNPNCVLVISSGDNYYELNLIVYEMSSGQMSETLSVSWISVYTSLLSAKNSAYEIERKLNGNNPVTFYETPGGNFEIKADNIWSYLAPAFPFTEKINLPFQSAKNNPDAYIKPLDIVRVGKSKWGGGVHTCIYLGNKKVAHNLPSGGVDIADWSTFANFGGYGETEYGIMVRYHPVIAYKRSDEIIQHIAKLMGGNFNIYKNNCESFVNKCVYNWDLSEHANGVNFSSNRREYDENGAHVVMTSCGGGQVYCTTRIPTSTEEFDRLSRNYSKETDIRKCVEASSHFDGIKLEQRIEIAPKSGYRMS
jgi:hypothetical protein